MCLIWNPPKLGWPDARGVPQSILRKEEVNQQLTEFKVFQLVIAALGALSPSRPFYMLLVPLWGPARKKREEMASACGVCERERVW